ncbi:hypothetical protein [Bacteroides caccae]|uniref:hypothetical protein n=1 Tax=Bacteroides caccae TaxID=47678 RepID=UPI001F3AE803|nr:hypothetical protein [Bacteroides caccae]MCE8774362.1 hypothetical protein [Bacteroides caccae]
MGAIGLNPIRLDAIGLDPIRFNAIKLGVPGASSATDRPYISPDVLSALAGVWIADGKSNTDPDRNIIKNKLPGMGGDFELLNFAYKLNSGYGKYEEDFTAWGRDASELLDVRPDKVIISDVGGINSYRMIIWKGNTHTKAFKAKVTGIPHNGILIYSYAQNEGDALTNISIDNDGVYEFPYSYGFTNGHGFLIDSGTELEDWIGCTIEFIPSLQGSLCTDGVNDMIVSQNSVEEMGITDKFTVVSMIHQITLRGATAAALTNYIRQPIGYEYVRNHVANIGKTGIYGYAVYDVNHSNANNSHVINTILGDKNDYSIHIIGNLSKGKFSVQGYINGDNNIVELSQVAWYWTFIAKRVLTTDEINQVIAYYNLDKYVKPDIYYDVKKQGLTNDTPDEDWYLKDFSGNGRDMTLYNYTKTPESGINEEGGLQSDGVNDFGQFVGDLGLKDYTVAADRAYQDENVNCVPFISSVGRTGGAPFLMEMVHPTSHVTYPYSFGTPTESVVLNSSRQISYQSTYVYNRNSIARGNSVKTGDGLTIGSNEGVSQYSKLCLWSFLLFPYTLSEFLLERQLKKHKLGTLYPGMVEFRPIVKSNIPYSSISYSVNPGEYVAEGSTVTITITLSNSSDKLVDISSNAISDISISGDNGIYEVTGKITKSPQKINIVISSYLTMLDNETLISNETLIKNE